jgi:hypothetical protein
MGRPLNKKYFGNRNVGTTGTSDNGIGGEGLASASVSVAGSYAVRPTLTFSAPQLPGGVRATATITSEVLSAVTSNGTTGTGYVVGDLVTFTGVAGAIGYVATVGSGVGEIQSITFTQAGTSRGAFEAMPADLTDIAVVGGSGTLGRVDVLMRAKSVVVTEKGSGYSSAPTVSYTNRGGITVNSITLTTDSGNFTNGVANADNQENAIIMYANVGNGAGPVDIIKQVSGRRYKVTDGTTTAIVTLGTDGTPETGEAYIVATATGGTYYVTKLTAHRATLVAKTGDEALDGTSARWTFGSATDTIVSIENA